MRKIFFTIIIFLISINVYAMNVNGVKSGYYVKYHKDNQEIIKEINYYFKNGVEGRFYIINIEDYIINDNIIETNNPLPEEKWEAIKEISYYGYLFARHYDLEWYIVTQYKIWDYLYPEYKIEILSENYQSIDEKIKEIDSNIKKNRPDLNEKELNEDNKVIIDNNNVLGKFRVINDKYQIIDNKLFLSKLKDGNYKLLLVDETKMNQENQTFKDSKNNYFFARTDSFKIYYNYYFEVAKTKIHLKSDIPCYWGVFDKNSNLIDTFYLNTEYITNYFINDGYYVAELSTSYGYQDYETVYYLEEKINNIEIVHKKSDIENINTESEEIINPSTGTTTMWEIYPIVTFIIVLLIKILIFFHKMQ